MTPKEMMRSRRRAQRKEAWVRLYRNKAAMVGLAILLMLFIVAIFAPIMTSRTIKLPISIPVLPIPLAQITWGVISSAV